MRQPISFSVFGALTASAVCLAPSLHAATVAPAPVIASDLTLQVGPAISFKAPDRRNNIAAPVAIGDDLYVVDQVEGISVWRDGVLTTVLGTDALPDGLTGATREAFLNIAGEGSVAYVAFTTSSLPEGLGAAPLPEDPDHNVENGLSQVIYRFDRAADGSLSNPTPLVAFERADNGHAGGGLLALPGGKLLFATGDGLTQDFNGNEGAQDPAETPGKLLLIDGTTGTYETAAVGLRNTQRLTFAGGGQDEIAFADIGWTVAEEINRITVADILDTSSVENFGWGVANDGNAREGTFYVSDGPEADVEVLGEAPLGEAGFVQPYAQYGRPVPGVFFAATGPVDMSLFSPDIDLLFGDLSGGALYATKPGGPGLVSDVFTVSLVDAFGESIGVTDLIEGTRADLRLFSFADGTPGMLFEREGTAFALSAVAPVPLPAGFPLLIGGLGILSVFRRRRHHKSN